MDEEIDLKRYAEVLWRARRVVASVVAVSALVAFLLSRFLLPKVYEASVLVVVETPVEPNRGQLAMRLRQDGAFVLEEEPVAPAQVVSLSPAGYLAIAESDVFQATLRDQIARGGTGSGVHLALRAQVIPQTNVLQLTVEAPRPEWAADWANRAAALLLKEAEELNTARMNQALELLEQQLEQSRRSLDEAQARLQGFIGQGPSVERLKSEQSVKLAIISDFESRLARLQAALAAESEKLETLKARLLREPRTVTLRRSLLPDGTTSGPPAMDLSSPGRSGGTSFQSEELNPLYVQLEQEVASQEAAVAGIVAEKRSIEAALGPLKEELQRLTVELAHVEADLQALSWRAEVARRNYETTLSQYEAQRTLLAGRIGSSNLTLVRAATPPDSPARPRVALNTVVAAFLALMAAVAGVFIAELWRSEPRPAERDLPGARRAVEIP